MSTLAVGLGIGFGCIAIWWLRAAPWMRFALGFVVQATIAVSLQVADDLASRVVTEHGTAAGIRNAHRLVAWEQAHGLWLEPRWQGFFLQAHRVLGLRLTWSGVEPLFSHAYIWGHLLVTFAAAMWLYACHRRWFPLVRNTCVAVNGLALVLYHAVPVSPPRLTPGLTAGGRPFAFQDPVFGQSGTWGGYYRFNEFAAMPSVHIAWAVTVAAAVFLLVRAPAVRALALAYPPAVLLVIVVTANHYLLDAMVGALVAVAGGGIALSWEWIKVIWRRRKAGRRPRALPAPVPAGGLVPVPVRSE